MSSIAECECRIPGTNSSLTVTSALVYLKGELAGNITLIGVRVEGEISDDQLLARLHLGISDYGKLIPAADLQTTDTDRRIRFYCSGIRPDGLQPHMADLYWLSEAEAGTELPFDGRDVKASESSLLGTLHLTAAQAPDDVPRI